MLSMNYRCTIVGYQKQLWGVLHYWVLLVLQEVTVGQIACGRLHVTEYVFPDGLSTTTSLLPVKPDPLVPAGPDQQLPPCSQRSQIVLEVRVCMSER